MADFSSYTHKWRAVTNPDHRSDANKISKRNRQPVSCQPCRSRKLKCDRGHPCDGCLKRGEAQSCVYGRMPTTTSTNGSATRKDETRISTKAQDRLKHLEDLVRSMVETPSRSLPTPDDSVFDGLLQAASSEGVPDENTINGNSYSGSTHWSAILQHISELRTDLGTGPASYESVSETIDYSKPDALFGGHRPHSLEQVLNNHLPPRIQVDRRVTQYFSAPYMIIPYIHSTQFRRQYEKFWTDPLNTNVLWISKMFAICCLAASLNLAASQAPAYRAEITQQRDSFESAAGQCLVLGNYSKPQPHVVEALALFLQCKYGRSLDPQPEVALMFGVQTRLAYMMGYHRDGSNFPNQITPFETEMRRRVWAMLRQFDLMIAFQLGIPNNVPPDSWDTMNPHNLLDSDFDEDTQVLPESRPENEATQILYFVVKARIVDVYSKVCHHAVSFRPAPVTVAEIMVLDKLIRDTAETIPKSLRVRPMSQSVTDPAYEIMVRINVSFLWRKSLCVLHRRYMIAEGNDYSYRTCVQAASEMCQSVHDIYPEFQPGGIFANDSWMLSSFTIVDYLLVTMILCLAMSVSRKKFLNEGGDREGWLQLEETKSVLAILDTARTICIELGDRSREAKRVTGVLTAVLDKLKGKRSMSPKPKREPASSSTPSSVATKADKPVRTATGVYDRDGISLKPLSLSERTTSYTTSTGMCPPSFYRDENNVYGTRSESGSAQDTGNEISQDSQEGQTDQDAGIDYSNSQRFMSNAGAPQAFNMNMDLDTGFFNNFMGDVADPVNIDWTQLDQFTGFFGNDPTMPLFDMEGIPTGSSDPMSTGNQVTNTDDWNSVPLFSLGARTIDPVTGMRHAA